MYKKKKVLISIFLFILALLSSIDAATYLIESSQWQQNLTAIQFSSIATGDIDNDGNLDLVLSGCTYYGQFGCTSYVSKIYLNNGTSLEESEQWGSNLTNINYGSLAFGDVDNDGDLDLAMSGCNSGGGTSQSCNDGGYQTFVYINNGTSLEESEQWGSNLTKSWKGSLAFGDINNDGKLDLALNGQSSNEKISKVYINNGTSLVESEQWEENLIPVYESSLTFGDIDNDGDLDLALCGDAGLSDEISKIYINNGTSLVENLVWQENLLNVDWCSLAFGDYDNDNNLDLSLIGHTTQDNHRIYKNNYSNFIEIQNEVDDLLGIFEGGLAFGDYDNNGYLDLAATGNEGYTTLYLYNPSSMNFIIYSQDPESQLLDLEKGSNIEFSDIDNDGDLDLILVGYLEPIDSQAKVYISNASLTKNNTEPASPTSDFSSSYVNNVLTLSWGNGSDDETNTSGLYYNLMVGNETDNNTIVSGVYGGSSNPTAGYFGNMMQRKNITLNVQLETNITYNWYVQTIDTSLAKSNWSEIQNFTTSLDVTKPELTIEEPSPNASLHTTEPYFIFNATIADENLTNVTLYADWDGSMQANETNSSGLNETYVFGINLTGYNDSQYSWYIEACDGDSNCQTSSLRSFYLDRVVPIVNLISPSEGSSWTSSSTVTFSYNVTDTDIANCSLIIDGSIDQTNTTITEDISQDFTKSLSNGNYSWQINCTDYVNFENSSVSRSLTVSYTPPSGGTTGGGGGAPTSFWTQTYEINDESFKQGYTKELAVKNRLKFSVNNEEHYVGILELNETIATIEVSSKTRQANLSIGQEEKFELTNDNFYELLVKLNSIENNKANLTIKSIYEEIPKESEKKEEKAEEAEEEKEKEKTKEKPNLIGLAEKIKRIWLVVIIIILLVIILINKFLKKIAKHREWKKYTLIGRR